MVHRLTGFGSIGTGNISLIQTRQQTPAQQIHCRSGDLFLADGGVNYAIKQQMYNQFDDYADSDMDGRVDHNGHIPDSYQLDLRLSTIKPHQAQWFLNSFNAVAKNHALIRKGWEKTGIYDVFEKARE